MMIIRLPKSLGFDVFAADPLLVPQSSAIRVRLLSAAARINSSTAFDGVAAKLDCADRGAAQTTAAANAKRQIADLFTGTPPGAMTLRNVNTGTPECDRCDSM